MEPLNLEESDFFFEYPDKGVSSSLPPVQHPDIFVTGTRFVYGMQGYDDVGDRSGYGSEQPVPDDAPRPTPPDLVCAPLSSFLWPEQLLDYKISTEAAKIAREILQRPDHNTVEYGSYIYRNASGVITHTPINTDNNPTSVSISTTGLPNWGAVLGMVHSHPASTYNAAFPDFKTYPTGSATGDWAAYDWVFQAKYDSLTTHHGLTGAARDQEAYSFRQYIVGAADKSGTENYELRGYAFDDRDQVTLGQNISLNLGLCEFL